MDDDTTGDTFCPNWETVRMLLDNDWIIVSGGTGTHDTDIIMPREDYARMTDLSDEIRSKLELKAILESRPKKNRGPKANNRKGRRFEYSGGLNNG